MGLVKPKVSGKTFVAKSKKKTSLGALSILNEVITSFRKAGLARRRDLWKGPEHLLPSVLVAPSGIWQLLERSWGEHLVCALHGPGMGPCADDALSTNLLHAVRPQGPGQLPNPSFPRITLPNHRLLAEPLCGQQSTRLTSSSFKLWLLFSFWEQVLTGGSMEVMWILYRACRSPRPGSPDMFVPAAC